MPSKKQGPSDQGRRTPPWLFHLLEKEIIKKPFALDAAASKATALCRRFYTEEQDGLQRPWANPTFCNPPFKHFSEWIAKGWAEAANRRITVVLVGPTGCSQSWFHREARRGTVYVPDERLVFFDAATGDPTIGADRDTMIYVFGPRFWNPNAKTFLVKPLAVRGLVVTSRRRA